MAPTVSVTSDETMTEEQEQVTSWSDVLLLEEDGGGIHGTLTDNWTSSVLLNGSFGFNGTGESWWTSVIYPSGYTPLSLLIASIFVTIIMIMIVGGNTLVIIAIFTERSLKGIQNWFIGSLAVADCLLGLIIMPFSLANEMMGYWVFGQWWCDVHSAVDVLLCTSSIMNLCLISLDRYWSITHAIEYLRKRTPERVVIMIATVWVLSGLISIPPLLGWKKETPQGEFPKCELSEDIGYVLYSALGSFYIPSCIMVFVYIRIYYAARARSRRAQENKMKRRQSQNVKQEAAQQNVEAQQPASAAAVVSQETKPAAPPIPGENTVAVATITTTEVVANGHPVTMSVLPEEGDRRASLVNETKPAGLLTVIPSVSTDDHKPETEDQHQPTMEIRSSSPSSVTPVNETSAELTASLGAPSPTQQLQSQPPYRQSSLRASPGDRSSRHSVTFEQHCSVDVVTQSPVRSISLEPERNQPEGMLSVVEPGPPTALTVPASLNRRASLIFPSRQRFQQLARRLAKGGDLVISKPAEPAPNASGLPNGPDSPTLAALKCEAEWSTSSCPSSPPPHAEGSGKPVPTPTSPAAAQSVGNPSSKTVSKNHNRSIKSTQNDEGANENEMASEMDPSSSDSGTVARCTVVRPLKIRFCRPGNAGSVKKSSKAKRQVIDTGRVVVRETDPARERRRINRAREKRATLILGLIMGAFIACWLPFFFLYLLAPMCPSCNIQPWGFAFAFWLGYINSALNPVIYTIFNKDFRHAFRRIIFRCTIANNY